MVCLGLHMQNIVPEHGMTSNSQTRPRPPWSRPCPAAARPELASTPLLTDKHVPSFPLAGTKAQLLGTDSIGVQLFPYHLSEYVCRVLRITPFRYYCDLLYAVLREERSFDYIPNFTVRAQAWDRLPGCLPFLQALRGPGHSAACPCCLAGASKYGCEECQSW